MNQTDFKALWQGLPTGPVPPVEEVIGEAKKLLRKSRMKLLMTNVTLVLTAAFIIILFFNIDIKMMTTRLGILLIVLSIIVYIVVYNRLLADLFRPVQEMDSKAYLKKLIGANKKQQYLQRTALAIYYLFLSIGICLYMIEYTMKMPLWAAILTYVLTLTWIGINWFVFRPRTIRKQQVAFDGVIEKLQQVDSQMGGE